MPEWVYGLLLAVGVPTVGLAVSTLGRRLTDRRLAGGQNVTLPVTLKAVGAPYPRRPLDGRLVIGGSVLRFEQRPGITLDLTDVGLRLQRLRETTPAETLGEEIVTAVVCADGHGNPVTFLTDLLTGVRLRDLLQDRPLPQNPGVVTRSRTEAQVWWGWPLITVLAGGVLALTSALVLLGGVHLQGTVTGLDADEFCRIAWTDPRDGAARVNWLDCSTPVGGTVEITALGAPFTGEAIDGVTPFVWTGGSLALVLIGAGGWLWRRWSWPRRAEAEMRDDLGGAEPTGSPGRAEPTGPAVGRAVDVPVLSAADLHWQPLSTVAQRRALAEGWSALAQYGDATPRRRLGRRFVRLSSAFAGAAGFALVPLIALGLAVMMNWTSYGGVLSGVGASAHTPAQVVGIYGEAIPVLMPDDLTVRFVTQDGQQVTTLVATRNLPDDLPATIDVAYSIDAPFRARALEYGGHWWGATTSSVVIAGALAWCLWNVVPMVLFTRRRKQALARGATTPARYALFLDVDGICVLLLFADGPAGPSNGAPQFAVALGTDLRGTIAPTGRVDVRGVFAEGEIVAVVLDSAPLDVVSPLLGIDQEELVTLVNATGWEAEPEPGRT